MVIALDWHCQSWLLQYEIIKISLVWQLPHIGIVKAGASVQAYQNQPSTTIALDWHCQNWLL